MNRIQRNRVALQKARQYMELSPEQRIEAFPTLADDPEFALGMTELKRLLDVRISQLSKQLGKERNDR